MTLVNESGYLRRNDESKSARWMTYMSNEKRLPLSDHGDMRLIETDSTQAAEPSSQVQLTHDHPGFRDPEYRARRNAIARIAAGYESGRDIPDAPYTAEEHLLWQNIRNALDPVQQRHACAEYLDCVKVGVTSSVCPIRESREVQKIRDSFGTCWGCRARVVWSQATESFSARSTRTLEAAYKTETDVVPTTGHAVTLR